MAGAVTTSTANVNVSSFANVQSAAQPFAVSRISGPPGVAVAVTVGVAVGGSGVAVAVAVAVGVALAVGGSGVAVAVAVGAGVLVGGAGVLVGAGVGVGVDSVPPAPQFISRSGPVDAAMFPTPNSA